MNFKSILFRSGGSDIDSISEDPHYFRDLNLDQIVANVVAGRPEYELDVFFHTPLTDLEDIGYRHAVFRDLGNDDLHGHIVAFAKQMRQMHEHVAEAEQSRHRYARQRWLLDAAALYCDAVVALTQGLENSTPNSEGLRAFQAYLSEYVGAPSFSELTSETRQRQAALADIHYGVLINSLRVTVSRYEDEPDYSAEVAKTFARFNQGSAGKYRQEFGNSNRLNQVETRILQCVAKLYPDTFAQLDTYCTNHSDYLDDTVARFEREIQFYMAYQHYMAGVEKTGLVFCYPQVTDQDKAIRVEGGFDLALAHKLIREHAPIVTNDFYLENSERIIVVSGPNQGGKTTFARLVGQLHYLARLGCPVPAQEARLVFYDRLFTHFERAEDIHNLRGKLEDDLVRIRHVLERATSSSIVVMNEIFSSTTSRDARLLGEKILCQLIEKQTLAVCVTFIDELASLSEHIVSMASTVEADDPAVRTFKILRKPADGLAYARALAAKHRLTQAALEERL